MARWRGYERADLRRHTRWVNLLETAEEEALDTTQFDPRDVTTWLVTPHRPRWIEADADHGVLTVTPAGQGCWRLGPSDHDILWIVANELPLQPELLPFLVARSGRPLAEFAVWAADVKGPDWIVGVLKELPMASELLDELHVPTDPEEQRKLHLAVLRRWLSFVPEAADDLVQQGVRHSLQHLFERRLGRPLGEAEQATLRQRLVTVGADRLGDVVLDLNADALAAWLADPAAR